MLDVHVNRRALSRSARVGVAAALVALALPIAGLQVFAQTANARLSGTVIDQSSAPVYEASVTLIDQRTQTRRSMPTDRSGRYAFVDVMPGSYRLQVEAVGFRPASEDVRLTDGQMGQQDVRLSIGEVYETITIAPGPGDKDRDNEERATPRTVDITVKPYDPRTEGSIRPPMRIANVTPVYPRTLLDSGLSDHAVLDAKIGTDGSIVDIRVRSSKNPAFAKAAMDAMSQWKYTPTLLHGKPVEVKIVTTIDFQPGAPRK